MPEIMQCQVIWSHLRFIFCNIGVVNPDHALELCSGAVNVHLGAILADEHEVVPELFATRSFPVITELQADLFLFFQELPGSGNYDIRNGALPGRVGFGFFMNDMTVHISGRFGEADRIF